MAFPEGNDPEYIKRCSSRVQTFASGGALLEATLLEGVNISYVSLLPNIVERPHLADRDS